MRLIAVAMAFCLGFAGAASAADMMHVQTPSGNIHCLAFDAFDGKGRYLDCEIIAMQSKVPLQPKPADCDADWGHRFGVKDTGASYMACASDTLRDANNPKLDYGKSLDMGSGLTCESSQSGLKCTNAEGHGFALSRASQTLF